MIISKPKLEPAAQLAHHAGREHIGRYTYLQDLESISRVDYASWEIGELTKIRGYLIDTVSGNGGIPLFCNLSLISAERLSDR